MAGIKPPQDAKLYSKMEEGFHLYWVLRERPWQVWHKTIGGKWAKIKSYKTHDEAWYNTHKLIKDMKWKQKRN